MQPPHDEARREIEKQTRRAYKATSVVMGLLQHPEGHPPEQLEDALNELQDAGYEARRAYGRAQARTGWLRCPDCGAEAAPGATLVHTRRCSRRGAS